VRARGPRIGAEITDYFFSGTPIDSSQIVSPQRIRLHRGMSVPRRHHFIPASYLAGFTSSGERSGQVWVFDHIKKNLWCGSPDNVGFEKDFYRMPAEGGDEFELERKLAAEEGRLIPYLQQVIRERQVTDVSGPALLALFALQAARGTGLRDIITSVAVDHATSLFRAMASDRRRYLAMVQRLREEGWEEELPDHDQLKTSLERGEFGFEFDQGEILKESFRHLEYFGKVLGEHFWSLSTPAPGAGFFVTSENPLTLAGLIRPTPDIAVQFRIYGNELLLPLARDLVLIGKRTENGSPPTLAREQVALVNTQVMAGARFVFSPKREFEYIGEDGAILGSDDLIASWNGPGQHGVNSA
jgi:hypothetical protein